MPANVQYSTPYQDLIQQIPYLSISTSIEPEASSTLQRCSFMYMSLGHHIATRFFELVKGIGASRKELH